MTGSNRSFPSKSNLRAYVRRGITCFAIGMSVSQIAIAVVLDLFLQMPFAKAASPADLQVERVFGIPPWNELTTTPTPDFVIHGSATCAFPAGATLASASESCALSNFGLAGPWFRSDLGVDSFGSVPPSGKYTYFSDTNEVDAPRCSSEVYYNGNPAIHCDLWGFSPTNSLSTVSPFLVGADNLRHIEIEHLLPNLSDLDDALGLAADAASAAIVLFRTTNPSAVTFTSSNATTLLPYADNFMETPPELGSATLTIPAKKLIAIGGVFYAAALLQAPPVGVTPAYTTPIIITAQQKGSTTQTASLQLVPPPVLLVHGIWGTTHSLNYYQTTLSGVAPWSSNPDLIYASDYPAASDFASSDSIRILNGEIRRELTSLQQSGVIVGRTDVVAHSMGGLLLRSTSQGSAVGDCDELLMTANTAPYRSLVNRCQGEFHTIVTLDTPEAGSNMASYLINHQDDTLKATESSDPDAYDFWHLVCGYNVATTVGQCLQKTNPVTGGGLASLVPASSSLRKAPAPAIPDATWIAVTATNNSGIARRAISYLIRATYANYDLAPTINRILHGTNDDVVSLTSQLTGSPTVFVTDIGLAHVGFIRYGIDEGVNNSALAATQTSCWLQDPSSPTCATVTPNVTALRANGLTEEDSEFHPTPGRLSPVALPSAVTLGQPLSLHITAHGVKSFGIDQRASAAQPGYMTDSFHETIRAVPSNSGGYNITVVPHVVGHAVFNITAGFTDGGFDELHPTTRVSVDPNDIVRVLADPTFFKNKVSMTMNTAEPCCLQLRPQILVRGIADSIDVGAFATYRVVSSGAEPIVKVDRNGQLSALRPGTTAVEVDFEGHSDTVPIVVESGYLTKDR